MSVPEYLTLVVLVMVTGIAVLAVAATCWCCYVLAEDFVRRRRGDR